MAVALHLERAITTLATVITQVISPLETPLVYHFLLYDVGGGIGEGLQEVAGLLTGLNDDGIGVGSQQAIADQGRDFAVDALVRILDQAEIGQRDTVKRGDLRGQCAVDAIDHILRGKRGTITELEIRAQLEGPGQAIRRW